jgi:FeS assembly SUF system protein
MADTGALRQSIIEALRTVRDPELPVNLYDLGLIYELQVRDDGAVGIVMTLTTPNCPVAESMPGRVKAAAESVEGVRQASVKLVWDPPWSRERMSENARLELDMLGITWSDGPRAPARTRLTVRRSEGPRRD